MSESYRNPRGRFERRIVEVPAEEPEVDRFQLYNFEIWRSVWYKQPILDRKIGHYRFSTPSKTGAEIYTRARSDLTRFQGIAREVVQQYVELPSSVESSKIRQIIHRAESTELATAVFLAVASTRSQVLEETIESIKQGGKPTEACQAYAADAIMDFGLCIENPYENNWHLKRHSKDKVPQGLKPKLDQKFPGLGTSIASFGAYAGEHAEVLESPIGLRILEATLEEQEYRINTWAPRHSAITEAFPDLPVSREIAYLTLPLDELLDIEDRIIARDIY